MYRNTTSTTINKLTKQVIYDKNFKNNFDIFDFLGDTGGGIKVLSSLTEEELIKINFFLIEWDAEGTIWIMKNTGEPKRISINLSNNETVDLEINSSKIISTSSLSYIDTSEYEIIDLRD